MFEKIKELLSEIETCPNIYVSQGTTYTKATYETEYHRVLSFRVIRRGATYIDNVLYKATCSEKDSEDKLKKILEGLESLKERIWRFSWHGR